MFPLRPLTTRPMIHPRGLKPAAQSHRLRIRQLRHTCAERDVVAPSRNLAQLLQLVVDLELCLAAPTAEMPAAGPFAVPQNMLAEAG